MKKVILFLTTILVTSFFLTSCVAIDSGINSDFELGGNTKTVYGSGELIVIEKNYSDFNSIEISNAFDITVKRGNNYSVLIRIDSNLLEHFESKQSGSTIKLGMERGYNYKNATMEAEIIMPDIQSLNGSGASSVRIDDFEFSHKLELQLSGASSIEGSITTGDLLLNLSGASSVILDGSGKDLIIECSGASYLDLKNYSCENAILNLSGASVSKLNVSSTIRADISGASVLYYKGNPEFTKLQISGESRIIKM